MIKKWGTFDPLTPDHLLHTPRRADIKPRNKGVPPQKLDQSTSKLVDSCWCLLVEKNRKPLKITAFSSSKSPPVHQRHISCLSVDVAEHNVFPMPRKLASAVLPRAVERVKARRWWEKPIPCMDFSLHHKGRTGEKNSIPCIRVFFVLHLLLALHCWTCLACLKIREQKWVKGKMQRNRPLQLIF